MKIAGHGGTEFDVVEANPWRCVDESDVILSREDGEGSFSNLRSGSLALSGARDDTNVKQRPLRRFSIQDQMIDPVQLHK